MNIRIAQPCDKLQILKLWEYCFDDMKSFNDYYFEYRYQPSNTIVIDKSSSPKEIDAALQLNQYQLQMHNKTNDISYIVGISTSPESRGSGHMGHLLPHALYEINQRQQCFALLMAIDSRLYTKYQFANIADKLVFHLATAHCQRPKSNLTMRQMIKADASSLVRLYNDTHKDHNIKLKRTEQYYINLQQEVASEDGNIYVVVDSNGSLCGYIVYTLQDNWLHVREWDHQDSKVLDRLLNFIYNHNTQVENVEIITATDDVLKLVIPVNKRTMIKLLPFMMGRIINVTSLFMQHSLDKSEDFTLTIKVKDNFLEHNNGVFQFTVCDNSLSVHSGEQEPQLELGIDTLTQLYCGYITVEQATKLKCINSFDQKSLSLLQKLFPLSTNYINEYI